MKLYIKNSDIEVVDGVYETDKEVDAVFLDENGEVLIRKWKK